MAKSPHRLLQSALSLVLIAFAASLGGSIASAPKASGATLPQHPILERAHEDLLQFEGQCWPWVRRVVEDSTGLTIGFGYRSGFAEAGAQEVSLADAGPGDVIQLADDANAGPWANYPGLHTAIIVSIEEPGVFTVIDSNSKWDGIVRLRPNYDPLASAARYSWIDVHVYRFPLPSDPVQLPDPDQAPPPSEPPPGNGDESLASATVNTPNDCLNLRTHAGFAPANVIWCLPHASLVKLLGNSSTADGYDWLDVSSPWGTGWVASLYVSGTVGSAGGEGAPQLPPDSPSDTNEETSESEPPITTFHKTVVGMVTANATN